MPRAVPEPPARTPARALTAARTAPWPHHMHAKRHVLHLDVPGDVRCGGRRVPLVVGRAQPHMPITDALTLKSGESAAGWRWDPVTAGWSWDPACTKDGHVPASHSKEPQRISSV
eukprot:CAMPEP_0181243436 /NCGR_PEP_ID=MMETSP1096-20121128/42270_1 /TAXON_ID=156174 ORGANISM="Chrysochromulina ericina, Strain CCMP281" /NCGR_SAMPLE_ID=MMETSP1096 /ASSEMBLY_ACC=CAM_ASM_000453 /LENGTH=114 /DNA_ID=CAMNT_0023339807 /DNA_START=243 /DNA_END=587 /DNA_ORIENTATION=+